MKRFNAVKKVNAKPMNRQEYNNLRSWNLPADEDGSDDGYLTEDINAASNLEGFDGYVSWTPKAMFEDQFYEAYSKQDSDDIIECTAPSDPDHILTDDEIKRLNETGSLCDCVEIINCEDNTHPIKQGDKFDFGTALHLMELGERVQREGWNGKGMFVYQVPAASYPAQRNSKGVLVGEYPDDMVPYAAYLALKTISGEVVPWTISQSDALAKDWILST